MKSEGSESNITGQHEARGENGVFITMMGELERRNSFDHLICCLQKKETSGGYIDREIAPNSSDIV